MDLELNVASYTLSLSLKPDTGCGTVTRLPDEVECSFTHPDMLLVLLETILGKKNWNANHEQIENQIAACGMRCPNSFEQPKSGKTQPTTEPANSARLNLLDHHVTP